MCVCVFGWMDVWFSCWEKYRYRIHSNIFRWKMIASGWFSPLCSRFCACRLGGSWFYRGYQRLVAPRPWPHSCQKHSATRSCGQRRTPAVRRPHPGGRALLRRMRPSAMVMKSLNGDVFRSTAWTSQAWARRTWCVCCAAPGRERACAWWCSGRRTCSYPERW